MNGCNAPLVGRRVRCWKIHHASVTGHSRIALIGVSENRGCLGPLNTAQASSQKNNPARKSHSARHNGNATNKISRTHHRRTSQSRYRRRALRKTRHRFSKGRSRSRSRSRIQSRRYRYARTVQNKNSGKINSNQDGKLINRKNNNFSSTNFKRKLPLST